MSIFDKVKTERIDRFGEFNDGTRFSIWYDKTSAKAGVDIRQEGGEWLTALNGTEGEMEEFARGMLDCLGLSTGST